MDKNLKNSRADWQEEVSRIYGNSGGDGAGGRGQRRRCPMCESERWYGLLPRNGQVTFWRCMTCGATWGADWSSPAKRLEDKRRIFCLEGEVKGDVEVVGQFTVGLDTVQLHFHHGQSAAVVAMVYAAQMSLLHGVVTSSQGRRLVVETERPYHVIWPTGISSKRGAALSEEQTAEWVKLNVREVHEADVQRKVDDMRAHNRNRVRCEVADPPLRVLQFGQRKGPAWERYQRELATLLEDANARLAPTPITMEQLLACAERAAS